MIDLRIENKLRSLGLSGVYQGYFCLIYAVLLVKEDPQRLTLLSKWLYPDVARYCSIPVEKVDGALRTAISRCCRSNPGQVALMCGGIQAPSVAQFIEGLLRWIEAEAADR